MPIAIKDRSQSYKVLTTFFKKKFVRVSHQTPSKFGNREYEEMRFRATSHTRLRARDRYNSSALIGGKGGASSSSLHATLEGPTEYVNARWM